MRNHGLVDRNTVTRFGQVSRMDTLQAAILRYRFPRLETIIERRRANAARYGQLLDPALVYTPPDRNHEFNTYHTYVVQVDHRDALQKHLGERGIGTAIHYPIPIHLQPASGYLGHKAGDFPECERQAQRILTLPVRPDLTTDQISRIAGTVNDFLMTRRRTAE
jgi:dTDP-4-amino-4,6-dideoxygalactose transaminase